MGLNPFKESNLADLQNNLNRFISDKSERISTSARKYWKLFVEKGRERITIMFIPHSEKKIVNFHISIFAISGFVGFIVLTALITSLLIVNHSSTVKEISRLKKYDTNSKIQIQKYKQEINSLYADFQNMKSDLTTLYSLTSENDIDSLWAKGGLVNQEPSGEAADEASPPIEILNLQEIEGELKISIKALEQIKKFLEYRRKIIENTPSIWPVEGFIVSRYGNRNSPHSLSNEFYEGLDIEASPGAPIKATAPGKVVDIKWDNALGLSVTIKHKYGYTTSYSHCQRVAVEPDQTISKGEVIGYVGRTGKTLKHICLYQIRIGTRLVDPMPYLNRLAR
jgi:murein DD-endopeptidase MepM/ murein hydrolase activator NlpD